MSIWQSTEYFMAVSVVALLLLAMKRLFHDKLDARWHYLIWLMLGVRMVVPLSIEWLKSPLSLFEAIPVNYWAKWMALKAERAGITAHLEYARIVYLIGVCLFAGYYFIVAVMIRVKFLRLAPAGQDLCDQVADVAAKYDLKPCKRIRIGAGAMPCVCGLICPILVLPKEGVAEEVIVHELLHKKYGDVWINYGLHVIRAINWFNPLIWHVTAVILNDSEALCDQRVLERMEKQRQTNTDTSVEKIYGNLLLNMARKKASHNAKIGTTNMANTYRNMHTRITRIADFSRVPGGVGFVALCITVVLSVSSIGYCETTKIISCGVEKESDLERVMLRALTYEAETKEEAIYLYLKAMKDMNPIYLMAVTPEAELPELETWIWEMFEQDKFVRWQIGDRSYVGNAENATYYQPAEWLTFREKMIENPWFVWNGFYMTTCWIYNLYGDETCGTAVAELNVVDSGGTNFVNWDLELLYENGWKVRRLGEKVASESMWQEEPEPMVKAEAAGGDWLITVSGYNEANFNSLFNANSGWWVYQGIVPTVKEYEESAEYPRQFEMQYKNERVFAVYQGEESLAGKEITIVYQSYTEEEFTQEMDNGLSLADLTTEKLLAQEEYDSIHYASSDGTGVRSIKDGKNILSGEEILITGGGGGPDGWKGTEKLHFIAYIYYDGECVEVIKQ